MNTVAQPRLVGRIAVATAVAVAVLTGTALAGPAPQPTVVRPAEASASPSPAALQAWRELARTDGQRQRDALLAKTLDAVGRTPADIRRLIDADSVYDSLQPGRHGTIERTVAFTDPADREKYEVSFAMVIPPGYRADRSWPVLLAAHGQFSDGPSFARKALRLLGADADKYIVVGPTMPGPKEFSGKSYQEQAYLQPLVWVKRHMNVDDNRVYLAGYSQGGHCTWHLATLFPREFAAAVTMAGTPWFEGSPFTSYLYLGNLSNLPLWSIWGALDKPKPPAIGQVQFNRTAAERLDKLGNRLFRASELPRTGHAGCYPPSRDFAAFLAKAKRNPMPEKFSHVFHLRTHARGYYMEAISLAGTPIRMDRPVKVSFDHKPTQEESDRKMEEYFRRFLFGFSAELDRKANMLTVKLDRVRTVRLYVMDGMFDLSKPVTIRIGSRTFNATVAPSAACILKHYAADRDASAVIVNEVDVNPAGRAVVVYR